MSILAIVIAVVIGLYLLRLIFRLLGPFIWIGLALLVLAFFMGRGMR